MITINREPTQIRKSYEGLYKDENSGQEYLFYVVSYINDIEVEWSYCEGHGDEIDQMIMYQFTEQM